MFQRERKIDIIICSELIFDDLNTVLLFETLELFYQKNKNIIIIMAFGLHNETGKNFKNYSKENWITIEIDKTLLDL